jgi:sugar phosphate isomerase/epimerase
MLTRRNFFAAAALPVLNGSTHKVRLGAPVFLKTTDPRELAREHRRLGYSAAYCPEAKVEDTARVKAIAESFGAEDVTIAEVGAWKNMLAPDAAERKANMDYIASRFALADAVGARCCVTIAGSYNPKVWFGPHPKNFSKEFFDATVANVRGLIDQVKPIRTKFAIEMMGWAIPDSPDEYLRLLKAVDRKQFGVHLDPCNGINSPARYYNNAAYIEDCFRKLGPHIVSAHAKDLDWNVEMNVHFREVIPGRGEIDYRPFLRGMASLPAQPPLMLEHLKTADEYAEGVSYIRKVAAETGVQFA